MLSEEELFRFCAEALFPADSGGDLLQFLPGERGALLKTTTQVAETMPQVMGVPMDTSLKPLVVKVCQVFGPFAVAQDSLEELAPFLHLNVLALEEVFTTHDVSDIVRTKTRIRLLADMAGSIMDLQSIDHGDVRQHKKGDAWRLCAKWWGSLPIWLVNLEGHTTQSSTSSSSALTAPGRVNSTTVIQDHEWEGEEESHHHSSGGGDDGRGSSSSNHSSRTSHRRVSVIGEGPSSTAQGQHQQHRGNVQSPRDDSHSPSEKEAAPPAKRSSSRTPKPRLRMEDEGVEVLPMKGQKRSKTPSRR